MKINLNLFLTLIVCGFLKDVAASTEYEKCLLKLIQESNSTDTIESLKKKCTTSLVAEKETVIVEVPSEGDSAVKKRQAVEEIAESLPFVLAPHRSNYVLPFTFNNSPNTDTFKAENLNLDKGETKFQFSVKSRIIDKLIFGDGDLWLAYTNLSFWQAYNGNESSPFRETNHEPEGFIDFHPELKIFGWRTNLFRTGVSHQSNGRGGELSRSWNRIYAIATIDKNNWLFSIKPWYRLPEGKKENTNDSQGDDNPDIEKFVGYGDMSLFYKGNDMTFGLTIRNNLRENNRLGAQFDWTFPLKDKLRGYVQYYNGYGESLVDYNDSVNRVGAGIMFSDIL